MCLGQPGRQREGPRLRERSEDQVLGALSRAEVSRFLRAESGLPLSVRRRTCSTTLLGDADEISRRTPHLRASAGS